MTDPAKAARRARHEAIRAEIADEETEAAEAEAAENVAILDVSLHLRISHTLDAELRRRAAVEHIPTSALVRRLLTQAVHKHDTGGLTAVEVEEIARRVAREELQRR
jgi:predicted DNA binding CopG/RHH family protein